MKADITQLLIIFDELKELTNKEQEIYWFECKREDGITITLVISVFENKVAVTIKTSPTVVATSLHFVQCSEINVLDEKKKCLEILHDSSSRRCFIALESDHILSYEE